MKSIFCGFASVNLTNDVPQDTPWFRKSILKKGRKLLAAGHVGSIQEDVDEMGSRIMGNCLPQTSIRKPNYFITFNLSSDRKLVSGHCSCKAGIKGTCKHAAAVIVFINEATDDSKTSKKQSWGIPATKQHYATHPTLQEMFPDHRTKSLVPNFSVSEVLDRFPDIETPLAVVLNAEKRTETERECKSIMMHLVHGVCDMELEELLNELMNMQNCTMSFRNYISLMASGNITLRPQRFVMCAKSTDFYNQKVNLRCKDITTLAKETISQHENEMWYTARKCRISSSVSHSIITRRHSFEHLATSIICSFKGNEATKYGQKLEIAAKASFSHHYKCRVIDCGVVVCQDFPFLCCSPDGIIVTPKSSLLEIKCPFSRKGLQLYDKETMKSYVSYAVFIDGAWKLKKRHRYYSQVQIAMFILNLDECNMYIYSAVDRIRILIKKDVSYLSEFVPKLEWFYFTYLLPLLVK